MENPQLVTSYCDLHRHSLSTVFSLLAHDSNVAVNAGGKPRTAGRANTLFVAYSPPDEYRVENERLPWMLLATPGEGVETERWQDVRDRPVWLDYQLCRHNDAGEVRWT